jgi:hypothetical protein
MHLTKDIFTAFIIFIGMSLIICGIYFHILLKEKKVFKAELQKIHTKGK